MKLNKIKPCTIGFLQALGVGVYCLLISLLFRLMESMGIEPMGISGTIMILLLLVFSAGITGTLVFGYFAFLMINKEIKRALNILGFTFLYCIIIMGIVLFYIIIK